MISILDYGVGNIDSSKNMFEKVGVPATVIGDSAGVLQARALVIPGVGQFDNAMRRLDALGLRAPLDEAVGVRRVPVLGICLGMQLMTRGSEEGVTPGLGWVAADCRRLRPAGRLRIPHMGWNLLSVNNNSSYFEGGGREARFYFVHSYAVACDRPEDVLATTDYGGSFVSAFSLGHIVGVQFHPEKSHRFGASFLRRFAEHWQLVPPC